MNQAKDWFRWASKKKSQARARGEMGKVPRTMGRRGLAGNVGQPNTREIAQAVYDENVAAAAAAERRSEEISRQNGWSPAMLESRPMPNHTNTSPSSAARNLPMRFTQAGIYGGNVRRTRKPRKTNQRSRRGRTRAHRR